jgi:hypothetical protein
LSVPAFFPKHHDERWRFLPHGLKTLLEGFTTIEIHPEGKSISGAFRTMNVLLNLALEKQISRKLVERFVFPLTNMAGLLLDGLSAGSDHIAANYSVKAMK